MKSKIPISISHPKLVDEWDFELNNRTPSEFTKGSSFKAYWKCKIGHSWQASIYTRYKGHGCPLCRSSTSLNELRLYSELIYIFPNAIHRYVEGKKEIDIFLPEINIGIEYDGLRWHKETEIKDRSKNTFFENKGIIIIRVRQKGLPKISNNDIITEKKIDVKNIIDELLRCILKTKRDKTIEKIILNYLSFKDLANEEKYNELLIYHPFPFKGRSLFDKYPSLTKEWNFIKNKNLTPDHFYPNSSSKVWWKCEKNHEWQTRISHRVNGSTCPICSGRVAGTENNLSRVNKALTEEWNFEKNKLLPQNYLPNSGKKVWWICRKGHEWQATIASRNSNGTGCPYCSGNIVLKENSIINDKRIYSFWNYKRNVSIDPESLSKGSNKKVWWKCGIGHEWMALVANVSKGSGCPYCSGLFVLKENSLGVKYPLIIKEWDYNKNNISPFEVSCHSKKKVYWSCKKNHSWVSTPQNRVKGTKCPVCSNKIIINENSLYTLHPKLIIEWDFSKNTKIDPKKVSVGSGVKVWWKCKKGHSWKAAIYHRTKNNSGCPYCANKIISTENSIATTHPNLIKEWDFNKNLNLSPEMFSYGSTKRVFWKYKNGHSWSTTIGKRTSGRGCPECYKTKNRILFRPN